MVSGIAPTVPCESSPYHEIEPQRPTLWFTTLIKLLSPRRPYTGPVWPDEDEDGVDKNRQSCNWQP